MVYFFSFVFFILGAIAASFAGVVVARLNTGQSFLKGRSRCDACDTMLPAAALVPILSFLVTRGRAQCCGARISWVAPLSEFLLGGLFVAAYMKLGLVFALVPMFLSLFFILALVLYDLVHQILPPVLLALLLATSLCTALLTSYSAVYFFQTLFLAVMVATVLAALHFFSHGRWMGLGDAPFAFALALMTNRVAIAGFIFSFWIGAVIGIGVLLKRPSGSRMGIEIPFAPFLAAGFLLAYFTQWNPFALIAVLP